MQNTICEHCNSNMNLEIYSIVYLITVVIIGLDEHNHTLDASCYIQLPRSLQTLLNNKIIKYNSGACLSSLKGGSTLLDDLPFKSIPSSRIYL